MNRASRVLKGVASAAPSAAACPAAGACSAASVSIWSPASAAGAAAAPAAPATGVGAAGASWSSLAFTWSNGRWVAGGQVCWSGKEACLGPGCGQRVQLGVHLQSWTIQG